MALIRRRRFFQLTTATAGSLGLVRALPSRAQDSVDSLKILVGYPPGGSNDVVARRVAGKLVGNYANVAVVDNKPGAAGRLVVDSLKSWPADGKTMLLTPSSVVTLYPHVYRQLSYDPVADLMAVASGALAYTGSYTVDEKTKTIHPTVMMATFPNMVGTNQQRVVTAISANEMTFTNPRTATGAVLNIVWKKAPTVAAK